MANEAEYWLLIHSFPADTSVFITNRSNWPMYKHACDRTSKKILYSVSFTLVGKNTEKVKEAKSESEWNVTEDMKESQNRLNI